MSVKKRGRPALYNWNDCFDGEEHIFFQGQDFITSIDSFRALVHRTANAKAEGGPWKAETKIDRSQKSVMFRFVSFPRG
jgi:hypothetical protein